MNAPPVAVPRGASRQRELELGFPVVPPPAGTVTRAEYDKLVGSASSLARAYNPDQPRDDHGRWTAGGSAEIPSGISSWAPGEDGKAVYIPSQDRVLAWQDDPTNGYPHHGDVLAQQAGLAISPLAAQCGLRGIDTPTIDPLTTAHSIRIHPDGGLVYQAPLNAENRYDEARKPAPGDAEMVLGRVMAAVPGTYDTGERWNDAHIQHAASKDWRAEVAAQRAAEVWWETRYSPDQPRDDHGRWVSDVGAAEADLTEEGIGRQGQPGLLLTPGHGDIHGVELGFMNQTGDSAARVWNRTAQELSAAQTAALEAWESPGSYKEINDLVRGSPGNFDEVSEAHLSVRDLDTAIASQAPTTAESVLYHYIAPNYAEHWVGAAPGTVLAEPGYVGTTPDVGTALVFPSMAGYAPDGAILEIHAPAGTVGMAGNYRQSTEGFREVLLPRGTEFKISDQPPTTYTHAHDALDVSSAYWCSQLSDPKPVRVDIVGQEPMGALP